MLLLCGYDIIENPLAPEDVTAFLNEAVNVRVTKELNVSDELTFDYPAVSEKAGMIQVNRMVLCEDQYYRIVRVSRGNDIVSAECIHVFFMDAAAVHLPSVADSIGVTPHSLVDSVADSIPNFTALSSSTLKLYKLKWIGEGDFMRGPTDSGEFKIDFFGVDKTNLLDFLKTVIKNAGVGELFYNNRAFAIVERTGHDTGIRLELSSNMEDIKVETDISTMITRLYPYGCDDMTIGSVYGQNYIDSPNISLYGVKAGYKDYSDYTDVYNLYYNAQWEFDAQNPDRIDVPSISISGSAVDLSKYASGGRVSTLSPGDRVTVVDGHGTQIYERVISLSYYPYEHRPAEITIGRVKRDLYFYISQISELASRYAKCSTTSGKISQRAISSGASAYAARANEAKKAEEGEG